MRRAGPPGPVYRIDRAGRVVVTADPADAAGDEVRVPRVLALHEDAVSAEDRRGAMALDDLLLAKVNLGIDAQAAHDPGNRVPGHLHNAGVFGRRHRSSSLLSRPLLSRLRSPCGSAVPPAVDVTRSSWSPSGARPPSCATSALRRPSWR